MFPLWYGRSYMLRVSFCFDENMFTCKSVFSFLCFQVKAKHPEPVYDLVANIVHDGEPESGTYRCHILHKVCSQY